MSMFRIGGVYRQRNGEVVILDHESIAIYLSDGCQYGARSLNDGADQNAALLGGYGGDRSLLPGELHKVNGEWVPMSGPSPQEQAEIDSFRTQPAHVTFTEPERAPLDWNKTTPFNKFEGYEVHKWISFDELCQGPRDVPQNAVQRMGDLGNPLHGSASLLKA